MSWFGAEIDGPMVAVRAVHFAATATTAGALMFRAAVAEPALGSEKHARLIINDQIRKLAWIGLVIAVVSGATWLLLQTSAISGETCGHAVVSGAMLAVLNETQFGLVTEIRFALAIVLAICLAYDRFLLPRWLALGAALCLVAAIAWTGHAASTPDTLGYLHLTADALHLYGAAAWTGGLVSLVFLLLAVARHPVAAGAALDAVMRFSTLGMVSVVTLVVSGIINAWILVGSFRGLILTGYGWLLMLKLVVFAVMVGFAAVNRFWLTPKLASSNGEALRHLTRNAKAEIALAFLVFAIVGLLGTLHPAAHLVEPARTGETGVQGSTLPANTPLAVHIHTDTAMFQVLISPGTVGADSFVLQLMNGEGTLLSVEEATLTLSRPGAAAATLTRKAAKGSDGYWHVEDVPIAAAGRWHMRIDAVTPSQTISLEDEFDVPAQ